MDTTIKAAENAPAATLPPATGVPTGVQMADTVVTVTPTQVRRPWRATLRTAVAGIIGFAALLPLLVETSGLDPEVYPWLAGVLAVAAAVTRIMAMPQVEEFLQKHLSFLAAAPHASTEGRRRVVRGEAGITDLMAAILVVFAAFVLILLFVILPDGPR